LESRCVAFQNHCALKKKRRSCGDNREFYGDPFGAVVFDLVAQGSSATSPCCPNCAPLYSAGKSRRQETIPASTFIEVGKIAFSQVDGGSTGLAPAAERRSQQAFRVAGFVEKLEDVGALSAAIDTAGFDFQADAAQTMKDELSDPAPKVAVAHIRT